MVCFAVCVLRLLKIGLLLLLYLIFEALVCGLLVATSIALIYWFTRGIFQVINIQGDWSPGTVASCNIIQVCFICWLLGMFTLKWVRSWSSLATPKTLQNFKERYHQLYAWSRTITVVSLLVALTYIQTETFFVKFYSSTEDYQEGLGELMYINDLKFLGSLLLLVYLCVRIFRHYRDTGKTKVEIELGDVVRSPEWQLYFEHYYGLLAYELFLTDILIMILLGLGVILEENDKLNYWFPYVCGCFIATGLGVVLGDVEERLLWLDNRMEEDYPYYRTIHWDVRLHLLAFFLLPMLSLVYFRTIDDISDTDKTELLHNLLHLAFTGVLWMAIAKGNTLFSYVVRGHYWRLHGIRGRHLDRHPGSQNAPIISGPNDHLNNRRIAPELQSSISSNTDEDRREDVLRNRSIPNVKTGITAVLKNVIADYFPVDFKIRKGTDQGSVSTGTCTSLMTTTQVNTETGSVSVQIPEQTPSEPHHEEEVNDGQLERSCQDQEDGLSSKLSNKSIPDVKIDLEETKSSEKSCALACDNNNNRNYVRGEEETEIDPRFKTEVTFSSDVEDHEAPIPLKRCPSNTLPVTYSD